jgi:hypothetical protein
MFLFYIYVFLDKDKLELAENQCNKLIDVHWKDFIDDVFWPKVLTFKDAGGRQTFGELAEFVLTVLSLPTSNAVAERAFNVMNCIKSKIRNILKTSLLSTILRVRLMSYTNDICCLKFTRTRNMFNRFNSSMYSNKTDELTNDYNKFCDIVEAIENIYHCYNLLRLQNCNKYVYEKKKLYL